jgi:hypothetical protein
MAASTLLNEPNDLDLAKTPPEFDGSETKS